MEESKITALSIEESKITALSIAGEKAGDLAWYLEQLKKDLPEGTTREVLEAAHLKVNLAAKALKHEAKVLESWAKLED